MNQQRAKELLPVITAFANGEIIECSSSNWLTKEEILPGQNATFTYDDFQYRIKPKPVTRPWSKPEDVPGPVCWVRADSGLEAMISAVSPAGISFVGPSDSVQSYSWEKFARAHGKLLHSTDRKTWHPCTVTEEQP